MKLIICILQDSDKDTVTKALNAEGFRVTVLPSSGAYFRRGNSTLLIGLEEDQVQRAIEIVRENCLDPPEPEFKRATVFVLDVGRFVQF